MLSATLVEHMSSCVTFTSWLGKAAGQDKKLLRKLAQKFPDGINDEMLNEFSLDEYSSNIPSSPGGPAPASSSNAETLKHGMPLKLFYFLVSTMNLMFPDYDFTYIYIERLVYNYLVMSTRISLRGKVH